MHPASHHSTMKLMLLFSIIIVLVALSQAEQESEVSLQRADREADAYPGAKRRRKLKKEKNPKSKGSKRRKSHKKTDKKRSRNPGTKDNKRGRNPGIKENKKRRNPKNKDRNGGKKPKGNDNNRRNRGRKQRPQAREGRQGIGIQGKSCEYIIFEDIWNNPKCTTGTKFVLKGGGGVRKQFLMLNNKTIQAWMTNGKKFSNCTTFTDITTSVKCKEVPGLASVKLGSTGSAAATTPSAVATTTQSAVATATAEASTATPTVPSTCPIQPTKTNLVFSEGGQNFTQGNTFHEDTGVLELVVPAHGTFRKTQFVIHKTGVLLKTKGACSLSPIQKNYNVSSHQNSFAKEMASRLQKSDNRVEDEPKYHILKIRQERVGHRERQPDRLHPAHSSACDDEPIVKTEDQPISEEQFKMIEAGKFITINETGTDEGSKRQTNIVKLCSTGGPAACGRGFENPYTGEAFSFHQISYGTLCVWCCPSSNCPLTNIGKVCDCTSIVNKTTFEECLLDNDKPVTNAVSTGGARRAATTTTQTLTFKKQSSGRDMTISVEMPAHTTSNSRPLKDMTVIMNADRVGAWHPAYTDIKNNMMTKIGDDCQVMDLPADMFPVSIAVDLAEIKTLSVPEDDIDRHFLNRQLDDTNVPGLHALVHETCPNGVKSTQPQPISKEDSEILGNGGVIFVEENQISKQVKSAHSFARQNCDITVETVAVEKASGSWRWPNNNNGKQLYIHGISTIVEEKLCCTDTGGGCCDSAIEDNLYSCKCSDITDKASFMKCAGIGKL